MTEGSPVEVTVNKIYTLAGFPPINPRVYSNFPNLRQEVILSRLQYHGDIHIVIPKQPAYETENNTYIGKLQSELPKSGYDKIAIRQILDMPVPEIRLFRAHAKRIANLQHMNQDTGEQITRQERGGWISPYDLKGRITKEKHTDEPGEAEYFNKALEALEEDKTKIDDAIKKWRAEQRRGGSHQREQDNGPAF